MNTEYSVFKKFAHIKELKKPEKSHKAWIYFGYFSALLGGILGVLIGWYLCSYKKTLPNGQKIFVYRKEDRIQGQNILIIGIFFMIFWVILRIKNMI